MCISHYKRQKFCSPNGSAWWQWWKQNHSATVANMQARFKKNKLIRKLSILVGVEKAIFKDLTPEETWNSDLDFLSGWSLTIKVKPLPLNKLKGKNLLHLVIDSEVFEPCQVSEAAKNINPGIIMKITGNFKNHFSMFCSVDTLRVLFLRCGFPFYNVYIFFFIFMIDTMKIPLI